jgi:hypothetical protein
VRQSRDCLIPNSPPFVLWRVALRRSRAAHAAPISGCGNSVMDQTQFAKPDVLPCDGASHLFDMNARPFVLKHNMAGHPLFTLDRLAQLATFLRAAGYKESVLHRDSAIVPHTMGAWDKLGDFDAVADAIRTCGTTGAWISLHDSEFDPEYREFLHDTVHSLSRIVGRDLLAEAAYVTGHIFIGSPNSITDFHFDSETNFSQRTMMMSLVVV